MLAAIRRQNGSGEIGVLLHDEQFDRLSGGVVRHADRRGLEHTGVLHHHFLDLIGIHVET
jgi:hypothetical protein